MTAEFSVDVLKVLVHGPLADAETVSDRGGQASDDEDEYVTFA